MKPEIKEQIERALDEHNVTLMSETVLFYKAVTHVLESPELYGLVEINKVRTAFADYFSSEGCSCCRGHDHKEHEEKLAELLHPESYEDGSGHDWYKYQTQGDKQ